jgi:hydroxymethylpyrimidine pyrophosphatase-like HAD family hydrolase
VAWRCLQLAEIYGCYFKIQDIGGAIGLRHSNTAERYSRYVHTPLDVVDLGEMKSCTERGALAALLFPTSPPMAAEIVGSLRTDFGDTIDITVSAVCRIEVRDAGATKGEAMRWLCESYLDIPVNERAAIGDGPADAAMLAAVGTGIAVRSDRTDVAQLFREAVATCDTPERGGVADAFSAMGIVNQLSTPDGSNSGASELDC